MFKPTLIRSSHNEDIHKLLLGFSPQEQEPITYSGDAPLVTIAPTRTGKSQCQVISNLLNWPATSSVIVLDVKDELYHYTAGYRAKAGSEIHKFDMLMEGGACFNSQSVNLGGLPPSWIAYNGAFSIVRCPAYGITEEYASCLSVDVSLCMDT